MQRTGIEYLTHTWNPIKMLCTRISVGCGRCWSLKFAARHAGNKTFSDAVRAAYAGGPPFLDTVELNAPMTMRSPAIIGTQFMGDLFHDSISVETIDKVFDTMSMACQMRGHKFVVLTKRAVRMRRYANRVLEEMRTQEGLKITWPIPGVILGVSAEDQANFDERVSHLMDTPGWKRMISIEPMLAPISARPCIDFKFGYTNIPDWIVCGGETGPGARRMDVEWARRLRDECISQRMPFWFKQTGGRHSVETLDGKTWNQRPF